MDKPSIKELLKSRILTLDGAMGTMIQRHKFSEEDYRGTRFTDYPSPLQGNNDLLTLTQPEAILEIHRQYFVYNFCLLDFDIYNFYYSYYVLKEVELI